MRAAEPDEAATLGRRLYNDGRNAQGEPVRALVGLQQAPLAGASAACVNCHGADGRGRPEGGVVPPDITWEELSKPYGHLHGGARKHGPFEARSFARAVNEGFDPDRNALHPAMPRYAFSAAELEALAAWLARLSTQRDPGVSETVLRIGTLVPRRGSAASTAAAMHAVLAAYFSDLNQAGGIHGRSIELVQAADPAQARSLFAQQAVFALVSPFAIGIEDDLAVLAAELKLPVIAPYTFTPAATDAGGRMFYLLAGAQDQARVLARYAGATLKLNEGPVALAVASGTEYERAAAALEAECALHPCGRLLRTPAAALGDAEAARRLMQEGVRTVFFVGRDDELAAALRTAEQIGWQPVLLAQGAAAARAAMQASQSWSGRLYLAYPSLPGSASSEAGRAFSRLLQARGLESGPRALQSFAYGAAMVFTEALRRSGRDLSRERLLRALEGLYRFDAGPVPGVSYGPGRRVGALGGYVVAVHPGRGFEPASVFIELE